jgi:signal transduction histidine kinase
MLGARVTAEEQANILRALNETGRWRGEVTHTHRDGTPIIVDATLVALHDDSGGVSGFVSVNHDITERRRAEEGILQQRERLEILHEIDRAILAARVPAEIARTAASKLREQTQAMRVTVVLTDFASETAEILAAVGPAATVHQAGRRVPLAGYPMIERVRAGERVHIEDFAELSETVLPTRDETLRAGIRSTTLAPLIAGGQVIGLLSISLGAPGRLPPELLELATQVADSLAVAIRNASLYEQLQAGQAQLRALSRRLVDVQERERRDVADQLYNEANQVLAALKMHLARSEGRASDGYVSETRAMLDRVMYDLHHLATDLRPVSLDRLGLVPALKQYVEEWSREHGLPVQFLAPEGNDCCIDADAETALYRIVQEALANVARHAQAHGVAISAHRTDGKFTLVVEDDGTGFDPTAAAQRGALGLLSMQERVEAVGGRLIVDSVPAGGTTVIVEVPIDSPQ